jgi:hypothetical protein
VVRWLKHGVVSTQPPDVARELEYLEEALEEVEAAARWYATRSTAAAIGFTNEIDAAVSAIRTASRGLAAVRSRHAPLPTSALSFQHRLSN